MKKLLVVLALLGMLTGIVGASFAAEPKVKGKAAAKPVVAKKASAPAPAVAKPATEKKMAASKKAVAKKATKKAKAAKKLHRKHHRAMVKKAAVKKAAIKKAPAAPETK